MNPYNTKLILSCLKPTPNSVRTPGVTSRAIEALTAPTVAITMVIAETAHLSILHLCKINQEPHFPSINYQRRTLINSARQNSQNSIRHLSRLKHYDYILNIISTNAKPTQANSLSNHPIKRLHSSKHHAKLGFVEPIIGLDVPSGNSPINPEMVENTSIFNSNPQEQHRLD